MSKFKAEIEKEMKSFPGTLIRYLVEVFAIFKTKKKRISKTSCLRETPFLNFRGKKEHIPFPCHSYEKLYRLAGV